MPSPCNETWLRDLIRTHLQTVKRVIRRYGVYEVDIEEIACRVFEVASSKRTEIEPGHDRQYLCSVAAHLASARRRAQERRRETHGPMELANVPASCPSLEWMIDGRRVCESLEQICRDLPPRQQEVFRLSVFEERTAAEVAAILDLEVPTVKSNLRRAKQSFRARVSGSAANKLLRELGFEPSESHQEPASESKQHREASTDSSTVACQLSAIENVASAAAKSDPFAPLR